MSFYNKLKEQTNQTVPEYSIEEFVIESDLVFQKGLYQLEQVEVATKLAEELEDQRIVAEQAIDNPVAQAGFEASARIAAIATGNDPEQIVVKESALEALSLPAPAGSTSSKDNDQGFMSRLKNIFSRIAEGVVKFFSSIGEFFKRIYKWLQQKFSTSLKHLKQLTDEEWKELMTDQIESLQNEDSQSEKTLQGWRVLLRADGNGVISVSDFKFFWGSFFGILKDFAKTGPLWTNAYNTLLIDQVDEKYHKIEDKLVKSLDGYRLDGDFGGFRKGKLFEVEVNEDSTFRVKPQDSHNLPDASMVVNVLKTLDRKTAMDIFVSANDCINDSFKFNKLFEKELRKITEHMATMQSHRDGIKRINRNRYTMSFAAAFGSYVTTLTKIYGISTRGCYTLSSLFAKIIDKAYTKKMKLQQQQNVKMGQTSYH